MTALPRLLVLMGSGETSPTMVKTHRELLARVPEVPAVLLDTPFGFQANAAELTARAQAYFRESVGCDLELASYKSSSEVGSVGYESALTAIRRAGYVFAGPGSPTYALRQWQRSDIPDILRSKLTDGGCLTFASAAALTIGVSTVPVYEIYKVGEPAAWVEGLDLLGMAGLSAAVIPHYNNAEGRNHDTRYCYLGEPRLREMELELPEDAFVLGVDEHTGVLIDLDDATATVVGLGALTVRAAGRSETFGAGTTVGVDQLAEVAAKLRSGPTTAAVSGGPEAAVATARGPVPPPSRTEANSPLLEAVTEWEAKFAAALAATNVTAAVQVVLDLEGGLHAWSGDTLQSDEIDRARAALRSMIVRLAAVAETGARDPRDVVGPFIEMLLGMRVKARAERRYADADAVRDHLAKLGVEVRDTPERTEWVLS